MGKYPFTVSEPTAQRGAHLYAGHGPGQMATF